jgi:hypothetical protein
MDLTQFYEKRNPKPADLLTTFNPQRLHPHGFGTEGIGGDPASTGPFYVFVTRPDLNLGTGPAKSFLGIGQPTAPEPIAKLLQGGSGFIKLISNLVENYSVQDVSLDTYGVGENWEGAKLSVPKSTLNSRQDGTIQLEFLEYSGLPITSLHKIWVDYIEAVTKGILNPKYGSPNYIAQRILDYACSIYVFQTQPDGATIEFGARFTGAYPTAIPFSPWAGKIGNSDVIKVTVPYVYTFMEPMDPAIFAEFNVSASSQGVTIENVTLENSKRKAYRLKFTEGKILEDFL